MKFVNTAATLLIAAGSIAATTADADTRGTMRVSAIVAEQCAVTAPDFVAPNTSARDIAGRISLSCNGAVDGQPNVAVMTSREGEDVVVTFTH